MFKFLIILLALYLYIHSMQPDDKNNFVGMNGEVSI